MKSWLFRTLLLLAVLLAACTPRIYGVPQDRWETMSEQERVATMEAYRARQEVLRQQREEQARLRAMEKQAQLAREAEEARQRQVKIDAIYRGEGLYGDLLRVTLDGGMLQFYGDHKPYHPVSFRIAASEIKDVEIVSMRGHKTHMAVFYDGSNLLLDEKPKSNRSSALRLAYEDAWEDGAAYPNRFAKGPHEMRGVDVTVQIVGKPPRDHHGYRHPPQVIIVKPPARNPHKPEVTVIKEPGHFPHPDVAVIDKHPHSKEPDIIVVKPRPGTDKSGKVFGHRPQKADEMHRPPARIKVIIRKGLLAVNKRRFPLVPQTIDLRDGQIRSVIIRSHNGVHKILVSYIEGELLLDDTPGRNSNHTRLGFVPGWKDGQRYAIEASGNRVLADLDLLVMSQ